MSFDFTDAPSSLIPDGTIATVSMHIRPGNVGEDGMLKRSANGECEMFDLELTVLDGAHKGRKFWNNLIITGTTDGQKRMAAGNLGVLKAILDSALGLMPNDVSAEARAARTVSLKQFEGMCFVAKIGEEKGGPKKDGGNYPDKNVLAGAVTKDKKEWHPVEQPAPFDGGSASAPSASSSAATAAVERPDWAQ